MCGCNDVWLASGVDPVWSNGRRLPLSVAAARLCQEMLAIPIVAGTRAAHSLPF
jgi:hypothetical protein